MLRTNSHRKFISVVAEQVHGPLRPRDLDRADRCPSEGPDMTCSQERLLHGRYHVSFVPRMPPSAAANESACARIDCARQIGRWRQARCLAVRTAAVRQAVAGSQSAAARMLLASAAHAAGKQRRRDSGSARGDLV
jgi:hypothetical protein